MHEESTAKRPVKGKRLLKKGNWGGKKKEIYKYKIIYANQLKKERIGKEKCNRERN